jgi:hypothetical protein
VDCIVIGCFEYLSTKRRYADGAILPHSSRSEGEKETIVFKKNVVIGMKICLIAMVE